MTVSDDPRALPPLARPVRVGRVVVGVVIGEASAFESALLSEIYACAAQAGHQVAVSMHDARRPRERAVGELVDQGCAVVIVIGAEYDDRYRIDVPLVVIGERVPDLNAITVGTDEWAGAQLAVQHLIDLGHSAIHHVEGGSHPCAAERLRGYRNTMAAAGLGDQCRTILGDYTEQGGADAARAVLADPHRPTAVFVANDRMALGFIDVLRRAGVDVPGDISVIGYDDCSIAALDHVSLTTVRQDVSGLARAALTEVGSLLDASVAVPVPAGCGFYGAHSLEPELVIRGTTSSPPAMESLSAQRIRWGLMTDDCSADLMSQLADPAVISGPIEAVASASTMVAWEIADRLGIMASYGIYDDLIDDPEIDAVFISLPAADARAWTRRAEAAGKVVRCARSV